MKNQYNFQDNVTDDKRLTLHYQKNTSSSKYLSTIQDDEWGALVVNFDQKEISIEAYMDIMNKHINLKNMENPIFNEIIEKAKTVKSLLSVFDDFYISYKLFVAGGAVRDGLLNKDVRDIDFFVETQEVFLDVDTLVKSESYKKVENFNSENPFIKYVNYLVAHRMNGFVLTKSELTDTYYRKKLETVYINPEELEMSKRFIYSTYGFFMSFLSDLIKIEKEHQSYINNTISSLAVGKGHGEDKKYHELAKNYLSGVLKFLEPEDNFDLIFIQPNCQVLPDFDWEICKASILLYEKTFIEGVEKSAERKFKKSERLKNKNDIEDLLENLETTNDKVKKMFVEQEIESYIKQGYIIKNQKTAKNYTELEKPIPQNTLDLMSRFRVDVGFLEDVELKRITYDFNIVGKKELERSLITRANKFKKKFSDYKINILEPKMDYEAFDVKTEEHFKYISNMYEKIMMELAIDMKDKKPVKKIKF